MRIGWGIWAFFIFLFLVTGGVQHTILVIVATVVLALIVRICYEVYEDKKIAEKHAKYYNKYKSVIEHPLTYEDLEEWQDRIRERAKNASTPEEAEKLLKQAKQLEHFKNQKIRTRKPKSKE